MKIPFVLMRIHNPAVAGLEEISRVINTNWSGIHNAKGLIEKNFYNKKCLNISHLCALFIYLHFYANTKKLFTH